MLLHEPDGLGLIPKRRSLAVEVVGPLRQHSGQATQVEEVKIAKRVAVLGGGWSSERTISLSTASRCAEALRNAGYAVTEVEVDRDLRGLLDKLTPRPDVVFNALMGTGGEDGQIQSVLEILELPYTHSGVLASALAMNKVVTRSICEGAGIRFPEGRITSRDDVLAGKTMLPPVVFKPFDEGSSIGVRLIRSDAEMSLLTRSWPYGEQVLVERFIPGREISVAVLHGQGLGAIEIVAGAHIFDYHAKYESETVVHRCPPQLPPDVVEEAVSIGCRAHDLLGCRGLTRTDFRCDDTKGGPPQLYMLEINTLPGMTKSSLAPEIAAHAGLSFEELVSSLVEGARSDRSPKRMRFGSHSSN